MPPPRNARLATEDFLIDMSTALPLDSDVLIAPHHGGDNGSSTAFIQAVSPEFVIFSAGHRFQHPRDDTVRRYLANGVAENRIFRTDRGDDEGPSEWAGQRIPEPRASAATTTWKSRSATERSGFGT